MKRKNSSSAAFSQTLAYSLLLGFCTLLFVGYLANQWTETTFDDSYMFLRYGHNFFKGLGWAWNPDGVQTYGPTSLPYVLVVGLAAKIIPLKDGFLLPAVSAVIGLLAFVVLGATLRRASRHPMLRTAAFLAALILISLVCRRAVLYHFLSGMDTTLSLLSTSTLAWFVVRYWGRREKAELLAMTAAAFACYLVRPDNGVYAVGVPLASIYFFAGDRQRRSQGLWFSVVFGGLLTIELAGKWQLFGAVVPLSTQVKSHGFYNFYLGRGLWNPIVYLAEYYEIVFPFVAALLLLGVKKNWQRSVVLVAPVILMGLYYFRVEQISGDHARYYLPSLPFVLLAGYLKLDDFLMDRKAGSPVTTPAPVYFLVVLASVLFFPHALAARAAEGFFLRHFLSVPPFTQSTPADQMKPAPRMLWFTAINEVSKVVNALPPGSKIAASEVGLLGARNPHLYLMDLVGLNDRQIAKSGFSAQYLFENSPDLIWLPHTEYVDIRHDIVNHPRFAEDYTYYSGVYIYGIAIKKSSPHRELLMARLSQSWSARTGLTLTEFEVK